MRNISFLLVFVLLNIYPNILSQEITLSPEESIADFMFLCEKLENVHPDAYNGKQSFFEKEKENIKNRLRKGEISIENFYLLAAPYIAAVQDGHTNMMPVVSANRIKYLESEGLTFPVKISVKNGVLTVNEILSGSLQIFNENDTIISINGEPASDIIDFLYSLIGSEGNNYIKDSYLEPMLSALLWYKYGWGDKFLFGIKNTKGDKLTAEMSGIDQKTALFYLNKVPINKKEPFELRMDTLQKKASLIVRTFIDPPSLGNFLEKAFQDINLFNIKDLIIDLRDNGGGRSASADSLAFYLTDKPYQLYSKILLKVSQEMKEVYKGKYPDIYNEIKDMPNGKLYEMNLPVISSSKDANKRYNRKLSVLCNKKTYSGASTFISLIKYLNLGNVEGISGQDNWYYGDYLFFKLPNSQINFTVSMKKFYDSIYVAKSGES